jgi:NIPSNAP
MTRRAFIPAAGGVALGAQPAVPPSRATIEITYYKLRNGADNQRQRLSQFLEHNYVPAIQRVGAGPIGVFANSIGPDGPFLMLVTQFPSMAGFEQCRDKLSADSDFAKALDAFNAQPGLSYERGERMLLRAFEGMPRIEVPPGDSKRPARIFEVRMYESNNLSTLRRKLNMFNSGEMGVFKRLGMQPVFFGEMIVGPKLPNLVYMLSFDDLAAREKAWRAFGGDPEWKKLRETPGWSDAEIVSNITNFFVSPLPFSQIR